MLPEALLSSIRSKFDALGGSARGGKIFAQHLAATDPDTVENWRARTRALVTGWVELLGLEPLYVGNPPDWHREAHCGLRAPRAHWSTIPYLDPSVVGDHKIVWEVNRHQYLYAPAMCWLIDENEEGLRVVQGHLASWLDQNPPKIGINWVSSLELAYRSITWCWLLWLLAEAPWEESLLERLGAALEFQALHIERNLSTYFSPNTHLTGEALGLFCIGTVLEGSQHAARWRELGARTLEVALKKQVNGDGTYFEQATLYHRYTAEIYLHYWRLATVSSWAVSDAVPTALSALFDVLRSFANGQGDVPLLGDDDGGMLLPMGVRSPQFVGGLLLAGGVALSRADLLGPGPSAPALSYALCGIGPTDKMIGAPARAPGWTDVYFEEGGAVVIRDGWHRDAAVAVIDAGPHGALNAAHAHADALAMTLSLGACPLFIDRGTLTYVGPERNEFRSTESHNTLEFDGESTVSPGTAFHWGSQPPRPAATLRRAGEIVVARTKSVGHLDSGRESVHTRVVAHLAGGPWLILDRGVRQSSERVVGRWQLAPGVRVDDDEADGFDIRDSFGKLWARVLFPLSSARSSRSRAVSGRYGQQAPASVLEAVSDDSGRVITLVLPAHEEKLSNAAVTLDSVDGALRWEDACGRHELALPSTAKEGVSLALGGWEARGEALWAVYRGSGGVYSGTPDLLFALGASRLLDPRGTEQIGGGSAETCRDVAAVRSANGWAILPWSEPRRSRGGTQSVLGY